MTMSKKLSKAGQEDRDAVLAVLKDKRSNRRTWHTFEKISKRTGLDIRRVMAVTGAEPFDIISTRQGYKHVSRATKKEIHAAVKYLEDKRRAMAIRAHGIYLHA